MKEDDSDIKIKVRNEATITAMEQEYERISLNKDFVNEVKKIRSNWLIPEDGFLSISKDFKDWLLKNKKDNFKKLNIKSTKIIKTNPQIFLNKVYKCIEDDGINENYPTDLYFLESEKTFYYLINERPFPGVVHFILFNNLFIPETRETQLTRDRYGNMVIRCGPNSTKRDVEELLSVMSFFQKKMKNYHKGKNKSSKLHNKDKEIYQNNLEAYEALDILGLDENKYKAKKSLATIRQRRKRFKNKIEHIS